MGGIRVKFGWSPWVSGGHWGGGQRAEAQGVGVKLRSTNIPANVPICTLWGWGAELLLPVSAMSYGKWLHGVLGSAMYSGDSAEISPSSPCSQTVGDTCRGGVEREQVLERGTCVPPPLSLASPSFPHSCFMKQRAKAR